MLPPPVNKTQVSNRDEELAAPVPDVPSPMSQVGTVANEQGKLTDDETHLILRECLKAEHREDPNVLRFISSYIRCRDTRQAAREAGLEARSGLTLRNRPDIFLAITRLTEKSVMKYGFDAAEVIEKVKEIAGIDPIDLLNPDGTYRENMHDIPAEARRAIKKFKAKNIYENDINGVPQLVGRLIEVELWDKMKASELLGREKGIFKETKVVEHDVTKNMAAILLGSGDRAAKRLAAMEEPILIEARKIDETSKP